MDVNEQVGLCDSLFRLRCPMLTFGSAVPMDVHDPYMLACMAIRTPCGCKIHNDAQPLTPLRSTRGGTGGKP